MTIGKGAILSVQNESGEYVEVGKVIDVDMPLRDLSQSYPFETRSDFPRLIVEDDLIVTLKQLGLSAVDATSAIKGFNDAIKYNPPYKITIPEGLCIGAISDHSNKRDHGWYQKFNKPHGKRNLR